MGLSSYQKNSVSPGIKKKGGLSNLKLFIHIHCLLSFAV